MSICYVVSYNALARTLHSVASEYVIYDASFTASVLAAASHELYCIDCVSQHVRAPMTLKLSDLSLMHGSMTDVYRCCCHTGTEV